jgi:hypothetical protein
VNFFLGLSSSHGIAWHIPNRILLYVRVYDSDATPIIVSYIYIYIYIYQFQYSYPSFSLYTNNDEEDNNIMVRPLVQLRRMGRID